MITNEFDYELMVQNALRSVVKNALKYVEKHGLPGDHHFYITFESNRNDVKIPKFLRQKYPLEVTIVLQYQFWDLIVDDEGFSVSLAFDDVREVLYIPYNAIISFLDPSVEFGLEFIPNRSNNFNNVVSIDSFRRKDK